MASLKPTLVFTLLCDDVRQETGGKFSLMGIFESISAATFPVVHPRFAVVNEWHGGKGQFSAKIRLLTPDRGRVIAETESAFTLRDSSQRHRDISLRFNTPFAAPGTYWLEMLLNDEPAGSVPLPVHAIRPQTVH